MILDLSPCRGVSGGGIWPGTTHEAVCAATPLANGSSAKSAAASSSCKIQPSVRRRGPLGKPTDRDIGSAGLGNGPDGVHPHASARLPRPAPAAHPPPPRPTRPAQICAEPHPHPPPQTPTQTP